MPFHPLRKLPSVNELLETPVLRTLVERVSQNVVVASVRTVLQELASEVRSSASEGHVPSVSEMAERIARRIVEQQQPSLRPVINATGVLLPAGLGSAPLAEEAVEMLSAVGRNYASIDLDLTTGQLSWRTLAVEALLKELTGAEAALVVNNRAAAVLLALGSIAAGREVVVSRGELGEGGDGFRLSDAVAASGAILREVGATNRTRVDDYARAVGGQTAALLLACPSEFGVVGFAERARLEDLVELGRPHQLPVLHDLGAGALVDCTPFGLQGIPVAARSVEAGASLVFFSGDQVLGGPQAGIIVGRRELLQKIERHPLAAAVRVDKLTLAALAATLELYRDPSKALQAVPLLHLLGTSPENLRNRAERLAPQIAATAAVASAEAVSGATYLESSSLPSQELPTWCVAVQASGMSLDRLAERLRRGTPSVVGRFGQGRFLLDLRSVPPRQDLLLVDAFQALGPEEPAPQEE